jgi:hypothetical protein
MQTRPFQGLRTVSLIPQVDGQTTRPDTPAHLMDSYPGCTCTYCSLHSNRTPGQKGTFPDATVYYKVTFYRIIQSCLKNDRSRWQYARATHSASFELLTEARCCCTPVYAAYYLSYQVPILTIIIQMKTFSLRTSWHRRRGLRMQRGVNRFSRLLWTGRPFCKVLLQPEYDLERLLNILM